VGAETKRVNPRFFLFVFTGAGPAVVNADALEEEAVVDTGGGAEWELWDVSRPLEGDCELKLHKWDEAAGKVHICI